MSNSVTWEKAGTGYWNVAANWSGGKEPGSADDVTLSSAKRVAVLFNATDTVASLTATNDLLYMLSHTLTVTGDTDLAGGLNETGGTLSLDGLANTIGGGVSIASGDLTLGTGDALTLRGATFGATDSNDGAHVYGDGTMVTAGTVNIAEDGGLAELWMGDGLIWKNTGTVVMAGIVNAYYNAGIAFTIYNQAHAVFDFTTDVACLMNAGMQNGQGQEVTASSDYNNAGLLEKTGGTGDTTVYSTITSTGTIEITTGTIDIEDGGTIGGTIEGVGTLQFADGGTLHGAQMVATTVYESGGDLIIDGATVSGNLIVAAQADQFAALTLGSATDSGALVVEGTYNIDNLSGIAQGSAGGTIAITALGTLAKIGYKGAENIGPGINDGGEILVADGMLRLSRGLSGTGGVTIDNGASFEVAGSVASGIIVTLGTSSDLLINHLSEFAGEVSNFVEGDTLDIGQKITGATAASDGTLTLLDNGVSVGTLRLAQNDSGDIFSTGTDGNGGTLLEITGADAVTPSGAADLSLGRMDFVAAPAVSGKAAQDAKLDGKAVVLHDAWAGPAGAVAERTIGLIDLSGTQASALLLGHHGHAVPPHFG
jgi:hypothetical protein